MMGTRPLVHTGFYKAWTAKGMDKEVLGHIQVLFPACTPAP